MLLRMLHLPGRPWCRPLFFILMLLASHAVAGQPDPLVREVTVSRPPASEAEIQPIFSSNLSVDTLSPVGKGLLRFYGCVTCHELPLPPYRGRWGPDLDTVGSKTTAEWLNLFLLDPEQAKRDSQMPRVVMSESVRSTIVGMLSSLQAGPQDLPSPGMSDGAELYRRGDCRSCHQLGGIGGDRGPDLDGIAGRIRKPWLFAYLMDPTEMVSNSRMPLFPWEEEEAASLTAYLLGDQPLSASSTQVDRLDVLRGISEAAKLGCFQCHRIARFSRTLNLPAANQAPAFVRYHGRNPEIRFAIPEDQADAMVSALENPPATTVTDSLFLEAFWEMPILMQGTPPAAHDSLATGIHPHDCAACHERQHREWRESLHATAMGPGVTSQLIDRTYQDPGFVSGCQECHAPNAEQWGSLPERDGYEVNNQFDSELRDKGVTCLACHVRSHARSGPPASGRPPVSVWRGAGHGGANESTVYGRSDFCSVCHQFEEGMRSLNGKLIQDTFAEWEGSPQASQGQTCQTCHMPDRSHTWLGVHDSATVAGALEVSTTMDTANGGSRSAKIEVRNIGAGHHLPTYVTPKIFVRAALIDKAGRTVGESLQTRVIGREIVLNSQASREVYDTRIPAGGTWSWRYTAEASTGAEGLAVWLHVYPDHFYARFFEQFSRDGLSAEARSAIDTAERNAQRSDYLIFQKIFSF